MFVENVQATIIQKDCRLWTVRSHIWCEALDTISRKLYQRQGGRLLFLWSQLKYYIPAPPE